MRRAQFDLSSQAIRNLAYNPRLGTESSAQTIRTNLCTNPSFETANGTTTVETNMVQYPSFETADSTKIQRQNLVANADLSKAGSTVEVRRNLLTNPSLESSSSTTEVRRNHAANPSFEGSTGLTIPRVNHAINPAPSFSVHTGWGTNGYGGGGAGTYTMTSGAGKDGGWAPVMTWTTAATSGGGQNHFGRSLNNDIPITAGNTYSFSIWTKINQAVTSVLSVNFYDASNNAIASMSSGNYYPAVNTWTELKYEGVVAPANAVRAQVGSRIPSLAGTTAGLTVIADKVMVEGAAILLGPYFDGNGGRRNYITYPAPTSAAGLYYVPSSEALGSVSYTTNSAGRPAMRSTRIGAGNYALYVSKGVSPSTPIKGKTYTWTATFESNINVTTTMMVARGNTTNTHFASNPVSLVAGVPQRASLTFTLADDDDLSEIAPKVHVYTQMGTNDWFEMSDLVWTDDTYTGEYFEGSGDYTYAWSGTPNASSSYMRATNVDQITSAYYCNFHQSSIWSTKAGTKSVRLTPTAIGGNGYESFIYTHGSWQTNQLTPGKTYTVSATLRLAAPLTGTLYSHALSLCRRENGVRIATAKGNNTAGTQRLSITFTVGAGTTNGFIELFHGGYAGSGDVWWDDLLIEETSVLKPYFDGNTTQTNLCANPSFAVDTSGWYSANGGSYTRDTSKKLIGSASLKVTPVAGNTYSGAFFTYNLVQGKTYTFSAYVWAEVGAEINFAADAFGSNTSLFGNGAWQRVAVTGLKRNTSTSLQIRARLINQPVFWVDGVLLEESSTASTYFEGTSEYTRSWTGAVNASASIQTAPRPAGISFVDYLSTVTQSSIGAPAGSKALRITPTNTSGDTFVDLLNMLQNGYTFKPSTTYTLSADRTLLAPQTGAGGTTTARVSIGGERSMTHIVLQDLTTPGTTRVVSRFTTDTGTTAGFLRLYFGSSATIGEVWYDNIILEEGVTDGSYFDGATPAAGDFTYVWTGTAHASTSVQNGVSVSERTTLSSTAVNYQSTAKKMIGSKSGAIFTKSDATGTTLVYPPNEYTIGAGQNQLTQGSAYTYSMWVWVPPNSGTVRLQELISGSNGAVNTKFGQWDRISVTFTAGSSTQLRLRSLATVPSGTIIYWANELLEESLEPLPYFDVSNPHRNLSANQESLSGMNRTYGVGFAGSLWTRATASLGATGTNIVRQYANLADLSSGGWYTTSVTLANDQTVTQYITLDWCDSGHAGITLQPGEIKRISATSYRPEYSEVYRFADIEVYKDAATARSILFKDWMIEPGAVATPFISGTGDYTYTWGGTTGASNHVQQAPGILGWAHATKATVHQSALEPKLGTKVGAVATKGFSGDGAYLNDITVVPYTKYTMSIWVKTAYLHNFTGIMRWKDSGYATISDTAVDMSSSITVGVWSRVFMTGTAPANAVKMQPIWRINAVHAPTTFYLDGAMIVEGHALTKYFDGTTTDISLITNPSFEAGTTGWSAGANWSIATSTEQKYLGKQSLKATRSSNTAGNGYTNLMIGSLTAGKTYTFSFYVYGGIDKYTIQVRGTATDNKSVLKTFTAPGAKWERQSVTFTAAATGATFVYLTDDGNFVAKTGDTIYLDAALLEETELLRDYYEGSGDFTYAWSGTAHANTSTKKAPTVQGWTGNYGTAGRVAWQSSLPLTATGSKSIAVISGLPNDDTFSQAGSALDGVTGNLGGRTFTISGTIRTTEALPAGSDGRAWSLAWNAYLSDGGFYAISAKPTQTAAGTYRVFATGTFPANATSTVYFRVYNGSKTEGNVVWWDDVSIIEGGVSPLDPYFDGSTPASDDYTYAWSGTANASTSTKKAAQVRHGIASKSGSNTASSFYHRMVTAPEGKRVAQWVAPAGTPNSTWRVGSLTASAFKYADLKAGRRYTLMVRWRGRDWLSSDTFRFQLADGTAQNAVMGYSESLPLNTTSWQEYRSTFTALSDATAATTLYIALPNVPPPTTDGIFEIREWMLVEGEYKGDYVDGSKPLSKWTGSVDDSISIGYPPQLLDIAGKPDLDYTAPGLYTLDGSWSRTEGRTFYTVFNYSQWIPNNINGVVLYGDAAFNDTIPNNYITFRTQGAYSAGVVARRTGGGGPTKEFTGYPAIQVSSWGMNSEGKLFCQNNNGTTSATDSTVMDVPHDKLRVYDPNSERQHIRTLVYRGYHDDAMRSAMARYLGNKYGANVA